MQVIDHIVNNSAMYIFFSCLIFFDLIIFIQNITTQSSGEVTDFSVVISPTLLFDKQDCTLLSLRGYLYLLG